MLLPFKAYTALAYFAVVIWSHYLPRHADYSAGAGVLLGYIICFLAFCVGGLIQKSSDSRDAYLTTCGFAIADLVFGFLLLPYLAQA
jgi:hypothetical protein